MSLHPTGWPLSHAEQHNSHTPQKSLNVKSFFLSCTNLLLLETWSLYWHISWMAVQMTRTKLEWVIWSLAAYKNNSSVKCNCVFVFSAFKLFNQHVTRLNWINSSYCSCALMYDSVLCFCICVWEEDKVWTTVRNNLPPRISITGSSRERRTVLQVNYSSSMDQVTHTDRSL